MNYSYIKPAILSVCSVGIVFSLLVLLFNGLGILVFNTETFSAPILFGMPIEIILTSFIVPAIALCLYNFLNTRFPNNNLEKFSLSVSNLTLGICIAFLFFGYQKWYTAVTFFVLFALLLYVEYVNKLRFMYRFYRVYFLLLIPFYIACLVVKNQPYLMFNKYATLQLQLAGVSIEMYFYFMGLLLMTVYLFEFFKSKMTNIHG